MDNQVFGTGGDLGGGRAVEIGGPRALARHVLSVLRAPEGESADDAGGGGAEGADPRDAVGRGGAEGQVREEGLHSGAAGGGGAPPGERGGKEGVGGEGGGNRRGDCSTSKGTNYSFVL